MAPDVLDLPSEVITAEDREILKGILADPKAVARFRADLEPVHKKQAEKSLHSFIKQMWSEMDSAKFKDNWHIKAICEHLQAVTNGEIRRLIINIPPRHQKSLSVSVAWPAWTWIDKPDTSFLFASHASSLSVRDSVKCRNVIQSPLYQKRWGDNFKLVGDQNTKIRYDNDRKGQRLSTSVGGALIGEGGNIIVLDDIYSPDDIRSEVIRNSTLDWWRETMVNRLNDPQTGAFVIIMQRLHEEDITGFLLETEGEDWTHLCLPARYESDHPNVWARDPRKEGDLLWPERFPEIELVRREKSMGAYAVAGQFQQRPAPKSGGMFDKTWWVLADRLPAGKLIRVRGWDFGATKDGKPSVGVLMAYRRDGSYFIEHVNRFFGGPGTMEKEIKKQAAIDGTGVTIDIPQDPGQAGKSQVRAIRKLLRGYVVRSSPEAGDKVVRASAFSAQADGGTETGNVSILKGQMWTQPFIDEAAMFPAGTFDDQVDAASRAFNQLIILSRRRRPRSVPRVG